MKLFFIIQKGNYNFFKELVFKDYSGLFECIGIFDCKKKALIEICKNIISFVEETDEENINLYYENRKDIVFDEQILLKKLFESEKFDELFVEYQEMKGYSSFLNFDIIETELNNGSS